VSEPLGIFCTLECIEKYERRCESWSYLGHQSVYQYLSISDPALLIWGGPQPMVRETRYVAAAVAAAAGCFNFNSSLVIILIHRRIKRDEQLDCPPVKSSASGRRSGPPVSLPRPAPARVARWRDWLYPSSRGECLGGCWLHGTHAWPIPSCSTFAVNRARTPGSIRAKMSSLSPWIREAKRQDLLERKRRSSAPTVVAILPLSDVSNDSCRLNACMHVTYWVERCILQCSCQRLDICRELLRVFVQHCVPAYDEIITMDQPSDLTGENTVH